MGDQGRKERKKEEEEEEEEEEETLFEVLHQLPIFGNQTHLRQVI